ncbi:LuxR C-terminal-related transcriptional regulator [Hydrogenophaga pseudoflava]|uniref:LuxR C-terminal-related transcriptional regulator n=1 Tax=Hydrogenophaga pseudoflava TaxID=47421 RepID=UPI0027E3C87F|nr:LuxR C-terminal-related transcriptional regulator [Hydrogenophaga pseudoflava]MDQ7747283.1 LuxR C-terminal-related transcriptional regulator [Hydrogenophaga pseudoflava]
MDVLETRLFPPRREGELISRSASQTVLRDIEARRLVLIKAPAGYGKSTLMVECYWSLTQRSRTAVWLSLNEFDGSVAELVGHLRAVLIARGVGVPELIESGGSVIESRWFGRVTAMFDHALRAHAEPVYVFLDDLHAIHGSAAERLLAMLVKEGPDNVRWIVGSRSAPGFPLARLRALGRVSEVDANAMRFTLEDTRRLLSQDSGRMVSERLAQLTHERTEGWAAGLQMMSIALQRAEDESSFVDRLTGDQRDVAAFMSEDVFGRLDPAVQSFLLRICVLTRFCPALCNALTQGDDGRAMVDELEASSLFIFSLDEERHWYRFHHLFAGFLQRQLREREPGLERELHRRASIWYSDNGLVVEAIRHALSSEDHHLAAGMLDRFWSTTNRRGIYSASVAWAEALPAEVLNEYPGVQLWRALYLLCERRFNEARLLIEGVTAQLSLMAQDPSVDPLRLRQWQYLLLHRKLTLAQFSDDIPGIERLTAELQQQAAESADYYLEGTAQMALLLARREQYRLGDCEALSVGSRAMILRSANEPTLIWHGCILGPALLQRGEIDAAIEQYRASLALVTRVAVMGDQDMAAMPLALLAEALQERYDLPEARDCYERAEPMGHGVGLIDDLVASYVTRARLCAHDGDQAKAQALLREGLGQAQAGGYERLRWHVVHERIRQAVVAGDILGAQRVASDTGLPQDIALLRPGNAVTTRHEVMAMAWARLAMASGRHAEALRLMRAWLVFAESRGAVASQVRLGILAARAQYAGGDGRGALRTIRQALGQAAIGGMVFPFVIEGEPIRSLVLKALDAEDETDVAIGDLRRRLCQALGAPVPNSQPNRRSLAASAIELSGRDIRDSAAPIEPLTAREVDILRFVSRNLLNKEIGDRLGLTEGSVKWYMQQIYDKLGVRRRLGALEKARALGYVN